MVARVESSQSIRFDRVHTRKTCFNAFHSAESCERNRSLILYRKLESLLSSHFSVVSCAYSMNLSLREMFFPRYSRYAHLILARRAKNLLFSIYYAKRRFVLNLPSAFLAQSKKNKFSLSLKRAEKSLLCIHKETSRHSSS